MTFTRHLDDVPMGLSNAEAGIPETATAAQLRQRTRIREAVRHATHMELSHAYFGAVADSGKLLTPFQLAELAAGVARAAVLNIFATDGRDARDVTA